VNKRIELYFAVSLIAVTGLSATLGEWTFSLKSARELADTYDRPLIVKFTNSSGKCSRCNDFEREVDSSPEWRAYASEQQLAMACIDYDLSNWDADYYFSILTNYTEVTSFPAFVVYASDGTTVLDAFTFYADATCTGDANSAAEAFVSKINGILDENDYLIGGDDLWDPVDNNPTGATLLNFQLFNQRQYHDLNLVPTDTDDWYKFECSRSKSYMLHLPPDEYNIDFTGVNESYISSVTNNYYSALTNTPPMIVTSNQVNTETSRLISVTTNKILSVTNGLPKVIVVQNTTVGPFSVSNNSTRTSGPYKSEIAGTPPLVITNGVPQDLIAPTLQILDPQLLIPLNFTLGGTTVTNTALLNQMEDGLIFNPPSEYLGDFCFIQIQQDNEGELPYFETVEYYNLTTNTTITVTTNVTTEAVVTTTTTSNITQQIAFLGPFPVLNPDLLPPDYELVVAIFTNETTKVNSLVVSNYFEETIAAQSIEEIIYEGSNNVSYTYSRTQYVLNYRFWDPGTISFDRPEISVRENSSSAQINISRKGGSTGEALFSYDFEDVNTPGSTYTAENGSDFDGVAGEISWADGEEGTKTINVPLIQDVVPLWEGDETFAIVMVPHATAELLQAPLEGAQRSVITLTDVTKRQPGEVSFAGYGPDDATPPMDFDNQRRPAATVNEGDSFTLWLERANGSDGDISVSVQTKSGSALEDESFEPLSEVITWLDGETQAQPLTINTYEQDGFNPDTYFYVEVSNLQDAKIGSARKVTVTLRDAAVESTLDDIKDAASQAGISFRTSGSSWFWDAGAALRSAPIASGYTKISLTLEGPGVISFDWEINDSEPGDTLTLDGGVADIKTLQEDGGSISALVKSGRQTLNWTLRAGSPAAERELYASLVAMKWQPVPAAFNPVPSHNGQTYLSDLMWEMPQTYAVALDGTFEVNNADGLLLTARVAAVSPAGAVIDAVTDSSVFDLWGVDEPLPGTSYRWQVSTLYSHPDGEGVNPGDKWIFKGIGSEDAEVTATPPDGLGTSGYYEAVQGVFADFGAIYDADEGITCKVSSGSLPSGLKMDSKTGRISGVPSRVEMKTVLIQASARVENRNVYYATVEISIQVNSMTGFDGEYNGWVHPTLPDLPYFMGNAKATLSDRGKFSIKIVVAGDTLSFSQSSLDGVDDLADPQEMYIDELIGPSVRDRDGTRWYSTLSNIVILKDTIIWADLTHYTLEMDEFGDQQVVENIYEVQCYKNLSEKEQAKPMLAAFEGYYTVLLPVTSTRDEFAPWGNGYLTLTIKSDGSIKVGGALADGNKVSLATTLQYFEEFDPEMTDFSGQEAFVYIYAEPRAYDGMGALSGYLRLTAGEQLQENTISEDTEPLKWWNFAPESVYGSGNSLPTTDTGFLNEITPAGGFYDKRTNLESFYLHQDLTFEDSADYPAPERLPEDNDGKDGVSGYLLYVDILPFGTPLTVSASKLSVAKKDVVYLSDGGDLTGDDTFSAYEDIDLDESVNLNNLKISQVQSTGLLKGAFELYYERENQNATYGQRKETLRFYGVMTRVHPANMVDEYNLGIQGGGYYLLPDTSSWLDDGGRMRSYSFDWSYGFELFSSDQ